jgi:tetratricopeptide (TPR) repeat protein
MSDPTAAAEKGRNLLAIGRTDAALTIIGEAIASDPSNAPLHVLMARAHNAAGDADATLMAAERALALEVSVGALHLAAVAHRSRREWDRSLELLARAIELAPEQPNLHIGRALTLLGPWVASADTPEHEAERVDDGCVAEAILSADRAAQLDPELALAPFAHAFAAVARDDLPAAAAHLERALQLDPEWSTAHLVLGKVRARQGMGRLASRHLAAAGRLEPTDTDALHILRRLTSPASRRARRRGRLDLDRVVPEAQRILEADIRLGTEGHR